MRGSKKSVLYEELARRKLKHFITWTKEDYHINWHHQVIIDKLQAFSEGEIKNLMVFMPPQHGKQISDDTPVLTSDGWVSHGNLQVGHRVLGLDGSFKRVNAVSKRHNQDCKVTLTDGSEIYCHENHEWLVYDRSYQNWRTVSTKYLESQKLWSGRARFQLPRYNRVLGKYRNDFIVDPYTLGVWLGDGTTGASKITFNPKDNQPYKWILEHTKYRDSSSWVHPETGVVTASLRGLITDLKNIGLGDKKRIPGEYLVSSVNQRLELLAGLMDTDGYTYHKRRRCCFSNCNKGLALDVYSLISTFGWRATISEAAPKKSTSGINGRNPVYQVTFSPSINIPCRIPRKSKTEFTIVRRKLGIKSIERVEQSKGKCIDVEDDMYLVGRALIPTHNSELTTRRFPAYALGKDPDKKIILCTYAATLASKFNRDIQRIIDTEEYHGVFPDTTLIDSAMMKQPDRAYFRNLEQFEIVNKEGFLLSVGVGGALTGMPADLGIIDDPYKNREEASSPTVREKVYNWYTDVFRTRLHNDSQQLFIMTRWHPQDLAGRLLMEEPDKWEVLSFEAIKTRENGHEDPRELGEALWPDRHSLEKILHIKENQPVTFDSLYQQDPKPNKEVLVFPNITIIDAIPDIDNMLGMDFGFTNDPTALIDIRIDGKIMYLQELIYETHLTSPMIHERCVDAGIGKNDLIVADSADPKTIKELNNMGLSVRAAEKGKDSIINGIAVMQEFDIYILRSSVNLIQEFQNYEWVVVEGKPINKPIDAWNHGIDAVRYAVQHRKHGRRKMRIIG